VASGYPGPRSIVLWTRIAPQPLAPGCGAIAFGHVHRRVR
jgi:phosphodiesterase/alkaline phosphatase D-like protein